MDSLHLYVNDVKTGQHKEAGDVLVNRLQGFKHVIEIGAHTGLFAMHLAERLNAEVTSIELSSQFLVCRDQLETTPRLRIVVGDCFSPEIVSLITSLLSREDRSAILCDGGNKIREFRTFAPFLKTGDVIMAHDYGGTREEFRAIGAKVGWHHHCEITLGDIQDSVAENNLVPWHDETFKQVFWGAFIKSTQ